MTELIGIARFKFHEGRREEYLRLSDQALDLVRRNEPGTLAYDLYLNGDQSECMFIERYRDSEAAIQHTATEEAPWYVVPADRKWIRDLVICRALVETLEGLDLQYPEPEGDLSGVTVA